MKLARLPRVLIESLWGLLTRSTLRWRGDNPRRVYMEFDPRVSFRTCREVLIYFELAGYEVRLRARWRRWVLTVARTLRWHRNTKLIWRRPAAVRPAILCTDSRDGRTPAAATPGKVIRLAYDYGPGLPRDERHFPMPIPMHCQVYVQYHGHEQLDGLRRSQRKLRLLFAGNWKDAAYRSPHHKARWGKLNRHEVVRFLQLRADTRTVRSPDELRAVRAEGYRTGMVLLDSGLRIDQADWLGLLAQADFFLCPPGIVFPVCHNAAESMAVGTIPFTNYADWFFPNLEHMKNSVIFSTLEDLSQNLDRVFAMPDEEVSRLRRAVLDYYTASLEPVGFVTRLLSSPDRLVYLHTWDEAAGASEP